VFFGYFFQLILYLISTPFKASSFKTCLVIAFKLINNLFNKLQLINTAFQNLIIYTLLSA